ALLGKWNWCLVSERDSLWCKVLFSKYGLCSNTYIGVGFRSSVAKLSPWESVNNHWFWGSMVRRVGDGSSTKFWYDNWLGSSNIKSRYRRLFSISNALYANIFESGNWSVRLLHSTIDSWEWRHDSTKFYSVRFAHKLLTTNTCSIPVIAHLSSSIWNSRAPLKIISRHNSLKAALSRRVFLSVIVVGFFAHFVMTNRNLLLIFSPLAKPSIMFGNLLYNWLNISVALPQSPLHHYSYHLGMVLDKKSIIWLATVWAIWKHQNEVIFNKVKPSTTYILDTAKVNVWLWLKHILGKDLALHCDWLAKPLECLHFFLYILFHLIKSSFADQKKRLDPNKCFPSSRLIFKLAINYYQSIAHSTTKQLQTLAAQSFSKDRKETEDKVPNPTV
ncbi:hypothetical protein Lal_00010753, partial [Lupinus albus]